jgi:hypothetical protein
VVLALVLMLVAATLALMALLAGFGRWLITSCAAFEACVGVGVSTDAVASARVAATSTLVAGVLLPAGGEIAASAFGTLLGVEV